MLSKSVIGVASVDVDRRWPECTFKDELEACERWTSFERGVQAERDAAERSRALAEEERRAAAAAAQAEADRARAEAEAEAARQADARAAAAQRAEAEAEAEALIRERSVAAKAAKQRLAEEERAQAVVQIQNITGADEGTAKRLLEANGSKWEAAVRAFFDTEVPSPPPPPPPSSATPSLGGQAAGDAPAPLPAAMAVGGVAGPVVAVAAAEVVQTAVPGTSLDDLLGASPPFAESSSSGGSSSSSSSGSFMGFVNSLAAGSVPAQPLPPPPPPPSDDATRAVEARRHAAEAGRLERLRAEDRAMACRLAAMSVHPSGGGNGGGVAGLAGVAAVNPAAWGHGDLASLGGEMDEVDLRLMMDSGEADRQGRTVGSAAAAKPSYMAGAPATGGGGNGGAPPPSSAAAAKAVTVTADPFTAANPFVAADPFRSAPSPRQRPPPPPPRQRRVAAGAAGAAEVAAPPPALTAAGTGGGEGGGGGGAVPEGLPPPGYPQPPAYGAVSLPQGRGPAAALPPLPPLPPPGSSAFPAEHAGKVAQLMEMTQTSEALCQKFLRAEGFDLDSACDAYFSGRFEEKPW